jgi:hypothetical protein
MSREQRAFSSAGIAFAVLSIAGFVIYGREPEFDASADQLLAFYDGDRTRHLIATVVFCVAFLAMLWFGVALSSVLRDAGEGSWAAAATASSAAFGAMLFLLMGLHAALSYSIAGAGDDRLTSGLHQLGVAIEVITAFPSAMFVMAGAFGLRRAGIISNGFFWAGVLAVVLVLLGGTTWASDGLWAPDGGYIRFSRLVLVVWITVVSGFLTLRSPSIGHAPERTAITTTMA